MSATVAVFVSSPDTHSERKFDLHLTVSQLKGKLENITGIAASSQKLVLCRSEDSQPLRALDDDTRPLGYYSVGDWMTIKVTDTNPAAGPSGQYSDVSQVEKFELTDDQYAQRAETLLKYKQANKLGRFANGREEEPSAEPVVADSVPDIAVGARCEIDHGAIGVLQKRGVVRYVGQTSFGKGGGVWVGIEYDEPHGRNDGSVEGRRYFTCAPNHGAFVRPERVTTGDFPPIDPFAEDEEM